MILNFFIKKIFNKLARLFFFAQVFFLRTTVSTLLPKEIKALVDEARQRRNIKGKEDPANLVEADPAIFKEIQLVY